MKDIKIKRKLELTPKGKIILGIIGVLIIWLILFIIFGNPIKSMTIEMAMPNDGKMVDDPILGMTLELEVGKKIPLLETIYPEKAKNKKREYVSENEEIAYVDENNNIIGKSEGTTKIYLQTKNGKVKSNIIEITIVE